jgi:tetratricopeptide (TPR) repeat protein
MAGTSRIDELRKKFDENPRRYFAPLANEYRKIGDFEQAIFICQEFLPQQPGHMSGHIVYGQALFESGRHDEARSVFETALALDPENLIALRHLGDIARALGDTETASAWYRRVLDSDPRNEEIAGILNSLGTDVAAVPLAAAAHEPSGSGESQLSASSSPLMMESAISAATNVEGEAPTAPAADPIVTDPLTTAPAESSFDDIAKLFTSPTEAPPAATNESLGLIHEGEDVLNNSSPRASEEPSRGASTVHSGDQIEKEEPPLGEPEHQQHAATTDAAPPAPEPVPATFGLPFLDSLTTAEPAPEPAPMTAAALPNEPAQPPVEDARTAFVTETMAELYVSQGHHEQAIDVYRQLVQLRPDDANLSGRLRQLENLQSQPEREAVPSAAAPAPAAEAVADAGPTIRDFLFSIAEFRPRGAAPSGDIPAAESESPPVASVPPNEPPPASGGSVGSSLNTLFADAERHAPAPTAPADLDEFAGRNAGNPVNEEAPPTLPGRPSKPAATELSLDHVFRHATPAAGSGAHSSFSFDQFFSQQAQQDVAAADAEPSSGESAGLSDDIQQFNAWLEGLKKS